ncbi:MAG: hypothetical protein P4L31_08510 [Candidatus Babeliales bacterium]|nr:hypothetical protein [Candidatus Babeliales bacterium]
MSANRFAAFVIDDEPKNVTKTVKITPKPEQINEEKADIKPKTSAAKKDTPIASKEKPPLKTDGSLAKSAKKEKKMYMPYALDSLPEQPAGEEYIMFGDYFGFDHDKGYSESDLYQRCKNDWVEEEAIEALLHLENEVACLIDNEVAQNDHKLIDLAHTFVTALKKFKDTFRSQYQPKNKKIVQTCLAIVAKEHRTNAKICHAEKKERRRFVPTNEPYARSNTLSRKQKHKPQDDIQ